MNILHKELSYLIQGAAIAVRKDIGLGHKEQIYQRALAGELKSRKISFRQEAAIKIYSPRRIYIGVYKPDFIIADAVVVELKALQTLPQHAYGQLSYYLRNSKYELGYLINFSPTAMTMKRIIFSNQRKSLPQKKNE